MKQKLVRLGVIGIGGMGSEHTKRIAAGGIPGAELTAVCDRNEARFANFPGVSGFSDHRELLSSGLVDGVLIATPHPFHTPLAVDAIEAGLHLLVDKPLGVHKADCRVIIDSFEARNRDDLVFAVMFNQRTRPMYLKLHELIHNGELGAIQRMSWTITDWFRTERYYQSGGWRATWKGEGGGVLLNQCPHQLDLIQWLFGMPSKVRAFGSLGKYHEIEVEDDVTAYMKFPDGVTGVFIASTGEAPGINRLEISTQRGLVVAEDGKLIWKRNEVETGEFSRTTSERFAKPPVWDVEVPLETDPTPEHSRVISAFVRAIRGEGELVAHGTEGIRSVELGNSMLMSLIESETVNLPMDGAAYESMLNRLIANSEFRTKTVDADVASAEDMGKSF